MRLSSSIEKLKTGLCARVRSFVHKYRNTGDFKNLPLFKILIESYIDQLFTLLSSCYCSWRVPRKKIRQNFLIYKATPNKISCFPSSARVIRPEKSTVMRIYYAFYQVQTGFVTLISRTRWIKCNYLRPAGPFPNKKKPPRTGSRKFTRCGLNSWLLEANA